MDERWRLLLLIDIYDHAIEELYVLGHRELLDLILRLERRRREAVAGLAELAGDSATSHVSRWVAAEIESTRALQPNAERVGQGANPATSPNDRLLRANS
jgi:hypothetical protein